MNKTSQLGIHQPNQPSQALANWRLKMAKVRLPTICEVSQRVPKNPQTNPTKLVSQLTKQLTNQLVKEPNAVISQLTNQQLKSATNQITKELGLN